jgi:hypothetical protein
MAHGLPDDNSWESVASLAERLTSAAGDLARSLDWPQSAVALHPFASTARHDWGYTPRVRPGLPLRDMSVGQRRAAWALVDTVLSAAGRAKVRGVLALEAVLQERASNKAYRDPLNYALALFGRPGPNPWAWRFEGHHVSLTLTVVPGVGIAVTPHFLGANPFSGPVVADGHGGLVQVLQSESALAFELVNGLGPHALRHALIAPEAPPDFLTGPGRERSLREPVGLALEDMAPEQQARAVALLETYLGHLQVDLVGPVRARVREAGLGRIRFAWAGATTPDRLHYYRLHGPNLIVEYDRTDTDHAHTVWHDPTNHFGEDYLRRHHETAHGPS